MASSTAPHFPVVALGASAGGLDALLTFFGSFETLASTPGMAFVVISHLAPHEKSQLAELLQRRTRLPVAEVAESTAIEADHIYVLRPNETLTVREGRLEPRQRVVQIPPHPIDDVFVSLAAEFRARAVAIVLSGTGSDGSFGLAAVKEAGGLVLAQAPDSAAFADMPRHAIETGQVDAVLRPAEMIDMIVVAMRGADGEEAGAGSEAQAESPERVGPWRALDAILAVLRAHAGIDFRQYKTGTLGRRIDRRVGLNQLDSWEAYARLLREKPEEREALVNDLLIAVTGFFRDAEAWEVLKEQAIRPLVKAQAADQPFRAWVAGCASGEEAYSLAMLLVEEAGEQDKKLDFEIFATDASGQALARARQGIYSAAAVQHLSETRRRRFFRNEGQDRVRISPELRESVIFAPQNLVQDPPFSDVRLIICRNVLIYLQPEAQRKLLRLFHFALTEGGYLFLGNAESIGGAEELFDTVFKKWRLFRRLGPTRYDLVEFPIMRGGVLLPAQHAAETRQAASQRIEQTVLRALAGRHAPPSLVVDRNFNVLYYFGATERFLKPQSGEPTHDLLALARTGLGVRLRRLIEKAVGSGSREAARARLELNGTTVPVRIEASPIEDSVGNDLILVSFREERRAGPPGAVEAEPASSREQELEAEVKLLHDELRSALRSSGRVQEELKSYNEEIMSMNEELRSANEELETSKEELQSINEELNTVNNQLRVKVEELNERTSDLDNLLKTIDVATLFLDSDLRIRWFSPGIQELFHVRESDVTRPIADLVQKFADGNFAAGCERVLSTLTPSEEQVRSRDGRVFTQRVVPYRTLDNHIDGVIVTFSDVTSIDASRRYAEHIVETVPVPLLVLDTEFHVVSANAAFYRGFQVSPAETLQRLVFDLGNGQWNIPELRRILNDVLPRNEGFSDYEVEHRFETFGKKTMLLSGRRVEGMQQFVLLAIEDITDRRRAEEHQATLMAELSHRVKNALAVVQGLATHTLASSGTMEEFRTVFEGRLTAYARGHVQLFEGEWKSTDLRQLIEDAVQAHMANPARLTLDGPPVGIGPKKSLALNLVLHELETNALKYGSLSVAGGTVRLSWTLEHNGGDAVRLVWQSENGPPVTRPSRPGFGTRLITQLVQYDMGGTVELRYEPEGLRCEMTFPVP